MDKITKLAVKRPVSVVMIILALFLFGISSLMGFNMELNPEMSLPMLSVIAVYPGADPESVEENVTKPIEDKLGTLAGVTEIESGSYENMAFVMVTYDYDVDMNDAYMDMRAQVDQLKSSLPDAVQDPTIMEMAMDATSIVDISATAVGDVNLLKTIEDSVVPELESINGVAEVDVSGGREDYIRVTLLEDKLNQYGLTMSDVANYITASKFTIPTGNVSQGQQSVGVSSKTEFTSITELQRIPVITNKGSVIQLSEIAEISQNTKDAESIARYNGNETINIAIKKKAEDNTVNVAKSAVKAVEKLNKKIPAVELEVINDSSETILSAMRSVASTLALGVVLSMIVLFLFFGDIKASLIVGSSMPISLLVTLIVMSFLKFSLNVVTASALVIAIGMMVDNSIVVIESAFRKRDEGLDFKEAAIAGASAVSVSVAASTVTSVVVFLPLALLSGIAGQMFKEFSFTIIFALVASLISAVTLVPLCFYKFKPVEKKNSFVARGVRKFGKIYGNVLRKVLHKKKTVFAVSIGLVVIGIALFSQTNMEMFPAGGDSTVSISVSMRTGTRLEYLDEVMQRLEELVASNPDVDTYRMTGSEASGTLNVNLKKKREMGGDELIQLWNKEIKDWTDANIVMETGGGMMGSMMASGVTVALESTDMKDLNETSKMVSEIMRKTPGVLSVTSDANEETTKAEIVIDPLKAMNVGLAPAQVAANMRLVLTGQETITVENDGTEYSVWLEYPAGKYENTNDLIHYTMAAPTGKTISLSDIATVTYKEGKQWLHRKHGTYQVEVNAKTTEAAKFTAQKAINLAVAELDFPGDTTLGTDQATEMMNEEFGKMGNAILTAIFLIFMVMAMQFESTRYSMMVMVCIPFSFVGSLYGMLVTNISMSMVSILGFLMLVGIVVNNGILFVDTTNQLRETMFVEGALIKTGKIRLRPILMTTLTTILSMVPLAIGIGDNADTMQSLGIVIIGGLTASTLLTLLLLPTFYLAIYDKSKAKKAMKKAKREAKREARVKAELEKNKVEEEIEEVKTLDRKEEKKRRILPEQKIETIENTAVEEEAAVEEIVEENSEDEKLDR